MQELFNPFEPLNFSNNNCFLTGKELEEGHESYVSVFPEWLVKRYGLGAGSITMLGGHRMKYSDMRLPVSKEVKIAIDELDRVTQAAFEKGYDAVKELSELTLHQWMSRVLYGVLFQDFAFEVRRHGQSMQVNPHLQQKLKNIVLIMSSLIRPIEFRDFTPWSIVRYRVNISKDILNYKDETQKINFCLNMNGFGIIACLLDNGAILQSHKEMIERIGDSVLHPAQFEELYGHFIYSNYLMQELHDYAMHTEGETLVFELPEELKAAAPQFAPWKEKTFAQVLANLWKPWGLTMEDIYTPPNSPRSYLINERTFEFIKPEMVNLPY